MQFKKDTNWLEKLKNCSVDNTIIDNDLSQQDAKILYHKLKKFAKKMIIL